MDIKNQNSTHGAEKTSFPCENLQEKEIGVKFAPSEESQETKEHGRYVSPIVDTGFKIIFEKEEILREFLNDLLNPPSPIVSIIVQRQSQDLYYRASMLQR